MMRCMGFVGLAAVVGLGCATQQSAERTGSRSARSEPAPDPTATGEGIPSDQLDEIQDILRRKQQDVAHCWTDEAERTHNRNLVIDVMLKFTIEAGGRPSDVQIMKNTVHSKDFDACVVKMVKGFDFPAIPSSQEMTWQYTFKALY